MARTIALKLTDADSAWSMFSGMWFSDNGGEPDGDAWLSTEVPGDEAAAVEAAKFGRVVPVRTMDSATAAAFCGVQHIDLNEFGLDGGIVGVSDALERMDSSQRSDWRSEVLFPAVAAVANSWCYYGVNDTFILEV